MIHVPDKPVPGNIPIYSLLAVLQAATVTHYLLYQLVKVFLGETHFVVSSGLIDDPDFRNPQFCNLFFFILICIKFQYELYEIYAWAKA